MKVIFTTNIPSPYRVNFFNELGKECELIVCYERESSLERNVNWKGVPAKTYKEVYLNLKPYGVDRSKGSALKKFIKKNKFDILVFTNYTSLSVMEAILYCKMQRIPYFIEYDGGFNKKESTMHRMIKRLLLGGASGHLTTSIEHIKYLENLNIKRSNIYIYPFTSVKKENIVDKSFINFSNKITYREKLGMTENHIILSVGRFIYIKGIDILIHSAKHLSQDIGIYIIGGKPTESYIKLCKSLNLTNIHFIDFQKEKELANYYQSADIFIMPTRGDIWGLVVNEAMSFGLPVISTDRCNAALELIKNDNNGYIIPSESPEVLAEKINSLIYEKHKLERFSNNSLKNISNYTIEKMAEKHIEIFKQFIG